MVRTIDRRGLVLLQFPQAPLRVHAKAQPFYGRGWTGVTQAAPKSTATGPAAGTYEQGIEDYKVLKTTCPATGTVGGTAYAKCGTNWWSYDTPSTIAGKMTYKNQQGLGGTFFWELSGDTTNGELIKAIN